VAQPLGALVVTATVALTPCELDALQVPPRERATIMCALAEQNQKLRELEPCPPPPPPIQENDPLELLGVGVVGVLLGGVVAWLASR